MRGDCNINDNECLRDNGSNLAAFLYSMMQNDETNFRLIEGVVSSIAPYFKCFKLRPDVMIRKEYAWNGKKRRLICILTDTVFRMGLYVLLL